MKALAFLLTWCALAWLGRAASGDVDTGFDPNASYNVSSIAMQADGKIVIEGAFTNVSGVARTNIARLNADGTLDTGFNPNVGSFLSYVRCTAVQADGKIVHGGYFTSVDGTTRISILRLNPDGTLDTGFNPDVSGSVESMAMQPDGKIVIGGWFSTVNGVTRNRIARLNADGTLDAGFNPNANGSVSSIAVQADGKIVISGWFSTVGGVPRNNIARLNPDGALDTGFILNIVGGAAWDYPVSSMAVQADGRIVIGGSFTNVGGVTRNRIARLNTDGTLDTGFNPNASSGVSSIALQADGKIVIGGYFSTVGGVPRQGLARLNPDGTLDTGFNPYGGVQSSPSIYGIAMQADGKIVIGGYFSTVGGVPRNNIARLENDPATQSLTVPSSSRVEWLRGGTLPETLQVTFELSTDGGATWSLLGAGTRITGGWERTGLALPASGHIHARARTITAGGSYGTSRGSSGMVEAVTPFTLAGASPVPEIGVEQPLLSDIADGGSQDFGSVATGFETSRTFAIRNTGTSDLTGLGITLDGADAALFSVTAGPTAPLSGPAGSTTFTVRFAPASTGPKSAALHLASNDPDENPFDISLTGNGVPPAPEIAVEYPATFDIADGGMTDFGLVNIGGPASLTWIIRNTGTADLTGLGITIDGPDAAQFSVTASPTVPVSYPAGIATFTVRFAPTSTGPKSAVLHIANNDPDENPFDITLTGTGRIAGPGHADTSFNPGANGAVGSTALQADGKIVIGGDFTTVGGMPRNRIARLNPDGSLDTGFNPDVDNWIISTAVQADGKIVIGGGFTNVGGVTRIGIARLNADGTVDAGFNANVSGLVPRVGALALQVDGRIVIRGDFTTVGGVGRNCLARLNPDGMLDQSFNPDPNGPVLSMALTPDGKLVIGGDFTSVGGVTRNHIALVNQDGTLHASFNPNAGGAVDSLAFQADGKLVIGGHFGSVAGVARGRIARLHPNGAVDMGFNVDTSIYPIYSTTVQADGKIIIGSDFRAVGGVERNRIARLNPDGTVDGGFNPDADGPVYSTLLKADGKLLIGGGFSAVGGVARYGIAQLLNGAATQSLITPSASRVQWLRGGTSPEAQDVSFELSINGGANWNLLGAGTRISGGWELTGLSLPAAGHIRARARIPGGYFNGSSGLIETVAAIPMGPMLLNPVCSAGQFRFDLSTDAGRVYEIQFQPTLSTPPAWSTLMGFTGNGTVIQVIHTAGTPTGFYRVIVQP